MQAVSVILRVPSLFIAEAWYRTDPQTVHNHYVNNTGRQVDPNLEIVFSAGYYAGRFLKGAFTKGNLKGVVMHQLAYNHLQQPHNDILKDIPFFFFF